MNYTKYLRSALCAITLLCTTKQILSMKKQNRITSLFKSTPDNKKLLNQIKRSEKIGRLKKQQKFTRFTLVASITLGIIWTIMGKRRSAQQNKLRHKAH